MLRVSNVTVPIVGTAPIQRQSSSSVKSPEPGRKDGSIFLDPSNERASNRRDAVMRAHVDMHANSNPHSLHRYLSNTKSKSYTNHEAKFLNHLARS